MLSLYLCQSVELGKGSRLCAWLVHRGLLAIEVIPFRFSRNRIERFRVEYRVLNPQP